MSLFKSRNINFDSSLFSDMQFSARNGSQSAIEKGRERMEQAIRSQRNHDHDQVLESVNNFSREFFSRIYEDAEEIPDVDPSWQSAAHDICSQLPEFERLQSLCMDDSDFSALATSQFLNKLEDQIGDLVNEMEDPDKDFDSIVCDYPHILDRYRGPIRRIIDDVSDDIGEYKEIVSSIGGDLLGSSEDKQSLLIDLSKDENIKKILKRAGKLLNICDSLPVKSSLMADDIAELEYGRDIKRTTSQQRSVLADPQTEDLFFAKWASYDLELLRMEGKEQKGRGPIHVLLDTSGSMKAGVDDSWPCPEGEASRNEWAKSVAIAMARIAKSENREFSATMFTIGWKSKDQFLPGSNWTKMISEIAKRVYDSGTCFNTLFEKILPQIKEDEDIVLITDGEDIMSKDTIAKIMEAKENGLRIFTIAITLNLPTQIQDISDQVLNIAMLSNEADISKALAVTMDNVRI